jgi:hypothetical protein
MTLWILILGTMALSLFAAARVNFLWHLLPLLQGRSRE